MRGTDQGIVVIPVIVGIAEVEAVVVRVQIQIDGTQVAVRVKPEPKYARYHLYHHPSNSLRIESNLGSKPANILHQVSLFLKLLYDSSKRLILGYSALK